MSETITTALHGRCDTCMLELATPERVQAHLRETQQADPRGRSHRVWRINPTAEQRITRAVEDAVEEALAVFCERIDRAVDRGDLKDDDVLRELRHSDDFADAWENWVAENRYDEDED